MSKVFNMVGGGGATASIVVTAPTGSTVTCTTPAGIVLTAAEVSGTWTFAKLKAFGTYIITSTDGMSTKTQDVLVDAAEVFYVKMRVLPIGYTKLQSISSNYSRAYFDVGFFLSDYDEWHIHAETTRINAAYFFGKFDSPKFVFQENTNEKAYQYAVYFENTSGSSSYILTTDKNSYEFDSYFSNGTIVLKSGTSLVYANDVVIPNATFYFGTAIGEYTGDVGRDCVIKCFTIETVEGAGDIADYQPCMNADGVVGIFDYVKNNFKSSESPYPFISGGVA